MIPEIDITIDIFPCLNEKSDDFWVTCHGSHMQWAGTREIKIFVHSAPTCK